MPYRPPASAAPVRRYKTKPLQIKPLRVKSSPVHSPIHSLALATREGGIGTRLPSPAHWTPAQKRAANALVSGYEGGARIGALGHVLDSVGHAYTHNPIYRNPIVGHKGVLGGLEDLVKTTDPIALGQTLAKTARHPLASRSATGLNAGVVVPGFGRGGLRGIKAPESAVDLTKETTPQDLVAKSLSSAERLRGQQKQMYREELGKRVAKAQAASERAGGGIAGNQAALRELRGELPKTTFDNLRGGRINQDDMEALVRHVDNHPELSFFDKITVNKALSDAVEHGRTPAPHEIKLLRTAFGPEAGDALSSGFKMGRFVMDIANVPRSIMASFDVSAPFRQGLVAGAGHPKIFAKNFSPMFKSLVSERHYQGLLDEIHARPNAPRYDEARLAFTELRGQGAKNREEQFSSDFAEKVPGLGHVIRASGRAYTGFLDRTRADVFDSMIATAKKKQLNVDDPAFLRSLGNYVNAATGRGDLPGKTMQSAAPALNTLFFSPRLMYSRINFLDPTWYLRGPKYGGLDQFARRQALKSFATLGAGSALAFALAGEYTRAKIGTDPRSADFAKIRLGNTRVDTLGGFQQYVRLAAQLQQGKIVSSTTGKTLNLGHGFGDLSRKDILQRFAEGKLAPTPSLINDFLKGTTFAGAPFSIKQAIVSRIVPLVAQDALDLQRSGHSIPLTALGYGISAFGIGMQTYGPKKKGPKKLPNPFLDTKPTESKSNPFMPGASSSSGSSSNPYMP